MQTTPSITPVVADKFRAKLAQMNTPVSRWARDNQFAAQSVYRVLSGIEMGVRGRSKIIADAIRAAANQ